MRLAIPVAVLLALIPSCAGTTARSPNPADKPGGATDMQPGSGGTYNDVLRSQGAEPPATGDTPQPAGDATAEPKKEPPPTPPTPPPPHAEL